MADVIEIMPNSYPERECPGPFDDPLEREQRMVSETLIWLNDARTKQIKIGLSPALDFAPTVKIEDFWFLKGVAFSTETFDKLKAILRDWDEKEPITFAQDYNLKYTPYNAGVRIGKKRSWVILGHRSCYNLKKFFDVITARLDLLNNQGFFEYYNSKLLSCLKEEGDIFANLNKPLKECHDQNSACMLEATSMHIAKVTQDIAKIMRAEKN